MLEVQQNYMKTLIKKILKKMGYEVKRVDQTRINVDLFAENYRDQNYVACTKFTEPNNPLWHYFQNHSEGLGIWKWEHYFNIYQDHFHKFVGQEVTILEIGIYSGGSLEMWKSFFGDKCQVIGVDIEEACRVYENDFTRIFIGDQESRAFWGELKKQVDGVDIIIDDGGHSSEQQRITLEEMLSCLRPGGVYICEDIHGKYSQFGKYVSRLAEQLNCMERIPGTILQSEVSTFQKSIQSIKFYPYCVVIEKNSTELSRLVAPRHGTEWQPFFDRKPEQGDAPDTNKRRK